MRLWHYKLIPFLPDSQLKAQWRELNSIFKNQPNHILINYVYKYPKHDLLAYSLMIMSEMNNRGFRIKSNKNFDEYFKNVYLIEVGDLNKFVPFEEHHDSRYLLQCFYNLQEKFDRGQKDFTYEQMDEMQKLVMFL